MKTRLGKATMLLVPLAWLSVAGGHGGASIQQHDRELNDPKFIAEGAKLFAPTCGSSYCHGTGGVGGGAPTLRGRASAGYLFKTISNGIPNTSMLSFKSELTEEQIWKVVAYIIAVSRPVASELDVTASAKSPTEVKPSIKSSDADRDRSTVGSIQAGKALFFDSAQSKSCRACHQFSDEGTPVGPNLSKVGSRSARELFLNIILGRETKDPRYVTLALTLRNGEKIVGVKDEEDAESIRVYDTTELPAVLRTVQKADIAKVETSNESIMPKDYASTYTLKQLLDIVTFLKSSQSESPITLKDLFR